MKSSLFVGLLIAVSAPAVAIDLKGAEIGAPANYPLIETALGFHFASGIVGGNLRCVGSCGWGLTDIAGATAETSITLDAERRLLEIVARFDPPGADSIRAALIGKYGKPSETLSTNATTGAGVALPIRIDTWRIAGDEIVLANFVDGAHGMLTLTAKAEVERKAAVARKNAGNI